MDTTKNQELTLSNRNLLTIDGIEKLISIKPNLVQLNSSFGAIIIEGKNLELIDLNNESKVIKLKGEIDAIKYTESKNNNFLRKIFKWCFLL